VAAITDALLYTPFQLPKATSKATPATTTTPVIELDSWGPILAVSARVGLLVFVP
jgi:hypothetical protein